MGYVFGWAASILFGGHYKAVLTSKKPKFFIQGDRDEFTGVGTLEVLCFPFPFSVFPLPRSSCHE